MSSPLRRLNEALERRGLNWVRIIEIISAISVVGIGVVGVFGNLGSGPVLVAGFVIIAIVFFELGIRYEIRQSKKTGVLIKGCVKMSRGVLYSGELVIEGGEWDYIDVGESGICENCRMEMKTRHSHTLSKSTRFYCQECNSVRDFNTSSDAEKRLKTHFENIFNSQDEVYSLKNIDDEIRLRGEDLTPRKRWEIYAELTNHDDVSIGCFP